MWDVNIYLDNCIEPDDYHNLETNLFCKSWQFPIFALLYTGAKFFFAYIECNGVPRGESRIV